MNNKVFIIPFITLIAFAAVLLKIQIFQEIILFIYLSFIPGFVIHRLLKIGEITFLDVILFSVGLSISFLMFIVLFVNQLHFLGFSEPLSTVPLILAISICTMAFYFVGCKRNSSGILIPIESFRKVRDYLPLSFLLTLLPLLSIIGALYVNIPVFLLTDVIIVVLCIMIVLYKKRITLLFS